jgi:DnaK suppressor protein
MTDTQCTRFKAALETKRQELVGQIQLQTSELAIREGEHDPIDQVQSMNHRDEAVIMLRRLSRVLSDVDAARRAMSEGLYGECAECGEPISLKRLESIPWASHCIRCQEVIERREAAHGAHPASGLSSGEAA